MLCMKQSLLTDIIDHLKGVSFHHKISQLIPWSAVIKNFDFSAPFKGMESIVGQIKALKENYVFIEPVEIPLRDRLDQVLNPRTRLLLS